MDSRTMVSCATCGSEFTAHFLEVKGLSKDKYMAFYCEQCWKDAINEPFDG
jgi:DNA-directed RNA polymerase subunit RPC12/RpoP